MPKPPATKSDLEVMNENMKAQLAEKDDTVTELQQQIDELRAQVVGVWCNSFCFWMVHRLWLARLLGL